MKQLYVGWCHTLEKIVAPVDVMIYYGTVRIIGLSYRGVGICVAGVWNLQTTSFEIP